MLHDGIPFNYKLIGRMVFCFLLRECDFQEESMRYERFAGILHHLGMSGGTQLGNLA